MNLYVGNLSPTTTEEDMRKLFSEFGEIVSVKILIDNATGLPRGFGFVEMADKFHSFDAIDNLDGTYLQGNIISVKEAKQNTKGGGMGNNNRRPSSGRRFNNNNNNSNNNSGGNNYNNNNY